MIEYLAPIAVFSLWFGLWVLVRAESRLTERKNKDEIAYFMMDKK